LEDYRFGKTGMTVSRFGLGCMRFPHREKDAVEMVRYAIDHGVNYLDTAYVYAGSEATVGKALKDGYRDKTYLATKCPMWSVRSHADFEKFLDEELRRLGTDHIDVYLLHNLSPENWSRVKRYDGFTFLDKMLKKGKIAHKAFSIHSTLESFKEIVDAYDWEMAQIQLNILDENREVGVEGLRYAAQKGLAVVVMEPLRGGSILSNAPDAVRRQVEAHPGKRSLAEWCFRWLYNMPEVSVILSGTSTLEQLKDNLRIFEQAAPNVMTEDELSLIRRLQSLFKGEKLIGCTACKYCMPCLQGIDIPALFSLYNGAQRSAAGFSESRRRYQEILQDAQGAEACIECGKCMEHCPQGLEIPGMLRLLHAELSGN